jgi:hypothetical protein
MVKLYGSIGYVILKKNSKYVLIFTDMHDTLIKCDNYTLVDKWLKKKFNSSHILLEEVDRNNIKLEELWPGSEHTQLLKKLFIENQTKIKPIDIRPFLIPFSWETFNSNDDMYLKQYLEDINSFFSFKNQYFLKKLKIYTGDNINKHFYILKKKYLELLENYKNVLNNKMSYLLKHNQIIFMKINHLLNDIMEWYICININSCTHNYILHTGLYHADKIIYLLKKLYNYKIELEYGITKLTNIKYSNINNGCVNLIDKYDKLF